MGPKISFSRDEIVNAAINVIRETGESSLTARKIAEKMNGSTQPIYRTFGTMERLLSAVTEKIDEIAFRFMNENQNETNEFHSIGMGYFNFAKSEPELFRYIYMSGRKNIYEIENNPKIENLLEKMRKDTCIGELDNDTLKGLLRDMSIYSHGLCILHILNPETVSEKIYDNLIHETGKKLVIYELIKKSGAIDGFETAVKCGKK